MSARFLVGDVFDRMAELPDGSVDLVVTSPPFLALRSYLPPGHPDKAKEIGSEATPAAFLDTMLALTAEWRRLLTPHGSIAVELGDTYAGSGGAGGDYGDGGWRGDQEKFAGSALKHRKSKVLVDGKRLQQGAGWPLDKSLTGIPTLYTWSLAYGRNLLTGQPSPAGQWRVRNLVAWVRPNPPVGALGDKFRPATSYVTVATIARDRWFDLDAVRLPASPNTHARTRVPRTDLPSQQRDGNWSTLPQVDSDPAAGAPPLDWWDEIEMLLASAPDGIDNRERARYVRDRLAATYGDSDAWEIVPGGYSGKVSTTRRERVPSERAAACGATRTTSPDCPVHADLPGQLPKALRDARAAETSPRTPRNGGHPEQGQLDGCAPTGENPDHSGSSPLPTSEQADPRCADAATPHSTAANRTAPAPATSAPDTASDRSSDRTGDTSTSPPSGGLHRGTPESSTSAGGSGDSHPETSPHTDDTRPEQTTACTCSWYRPVTESTSHYAVFPPELPKRLIDSMCPRRVCTTCGTPSRRIVETTNSVGHAVGRTAWTRDSATAALMHTGRITVDANHHSVPDRAERVTLGWSDCGCPGDDRWRPGHVLDPFAGSGTTLAVASGMGRDSTGIDLDERNADLARERVGMFLDIDHRPVPEDVA